jgi:hypothetical protein
VSTQLATQVETGERRRRLARRVAVSLLGPVTAGIGVVWALAQPYRLTFLHPHGQSFWNLAVEPPLLVVLVGVLFQLLILPALLEDLAEESDS